MVMGNPNISLKNFCDVCGRNGNRKHLVTPFSPAWGGRCSGIHRSGNNNTFLKRKMPEVRVKLEKMLQD
jgi:hypothetical protein